MFYSTASQTSCRETSKRENEPQLGQPEESLGAAAGKGANEQPSTHHPIMQVLLLWAKKALLLFFLLQEAAQRRVEKAEILEHTVVFLQKTRDKDGSEAGGGSQQDSFQEGFSDCMERAVRFLGPVGKGLCLRAVLDPSASARSSPPHFGSAKGTSRSELHPSSSSQLLRRSCKSLLHLWLHRPGAVPGPVAFRCLQRPGQSQRPLPSPQMRDGANKQNHLQSQPASRSLWRPWP